MNMEKSKEAEVKIIAINVAKEFLNNIDSKIEGLNKHIIDVQVDVALIKGQLSGRKSKPPKGNLAGMDWLKVVSLIIGISGGFIVLFNALIK